MNTSVSPVVNSNEKKIVVPDEVDDNEFSLTDLYSPKSKYTAEQKMSAVMGMVITGNSEKAGKLAGVKPATIRWWKTQATWWPGAMAKCQREKNDELDAAQTRIISLCVSQIENQLKNGEEVLDKNGNRIRKEVSARDCSVIAATQQDKRALLRHEPTSITAKTQTEIIADLVNKCLSLSEELRNKNVVSVQ